VRATATERLAVYQDMYRARLAEALESQYPRLAKLLGSGFGELAAAFVHDEPSLRPSLRDLGRPLPAWLASRRPGVLGLSALARLEWARTDVFDLADDAVLTLDALRAWPAERFGELPIQLVQAHRLIAVEAGTAALWSAVGTGELPPLVGTEDTLELLAIWRDGLNVYHRIVDTHEHGALELAAKGTSFGTICERLAERCGAQDAVARAFAWLSTWTTDGLIVEPPALA
jgi:hypothetical protein